MSWYGQHHLTPRYTNILVKRWQAPPGNVADRYYTEFPNLYPYHLPDDHYKVKYNETLYPRHRDYRTFKKAPQETKPKCSIEWEDGYGPCNVCPECIAVKKQNDEQSRIYYTKLRAWRENGTSML